MISKDFTQISFEFIKNLHPSLKIYLCLPLVNKNALCIFFESARLYKLINFLEERIKMKKRFTKIQSGQKAKKSMSQSSNDVPNIKSSDHSTVNKLTGKRKSKSIHDEEQCAVVTSLPPFAETNNSDIADDTNSFDKSNDSSEINPSASLISKKQKSNPLIITDSLSSSIFLNNISSSETEANTCDVTHNEFSTDQTTRRKLKNNSNSAFITDKPCSTLSRAKSNKKQSLSHIEPSLLRNEELYSTTHNNYLNNTMRNLASTAHQLNSNPILNATSSNHYAVSHIRDADMESPVIIPIRENAFLTSSSSSFSTSMMNRPGPTTTSTAHSYTTNVIPVPTTNMARAIPVVTTTTSSSSSSSAGVPLITKKKKTKPKGKLHR